MAEVEEVVHRLLHARCVVGPDRVGLEVDLAIEEDGRHAQLLQPLDAARVLLAVDRHQQAVDAAVLKQVDGLGFLARLAAGVDEVQPVAVLAEFGLGALEHHGVDRD